jgi:hypothetical protein
MSNTLIVYLGDTEIIDTEWGIVPESSEVQHFNGKAFKLKKSHRFRFGDGRTKIDIARAITKIAKFTIKPADLQERAGREYFTTVVVWVMDEVFHEDE